MAQEDAWEQTAQLLAMVHNWGLINSRSFYGPAIKDSELKDPDDLNAWLRVPGNETPEEERRKKEDAIIAQRKEDAKRRREQDGGKS